MPLRILYMFLATRLARAERIRREDVGMPPRAMLSIHYLHIRFDIKSGCIIEDVERYLKDDERCRVDRRVARLCSDDWREPRAIEASDAVAVAQALTEGVVAARMGTMRSVPERASLHLFNYLAGVMHHMPRVISYINMCIETTYYKTYHTDTHTYVDNSMTE